MMTKLLPAVATLGIFSAAASGFRREALPRQAATAQRRRSQSQAPLALLPEIWWRTFRDSSLNRLIDSALAENFNLRAIANRIDQANAELRQAESRLFPQFCSGEPLAKLSRRASRQPRFSVLLAGPGDFLLESGQW